MSEDNQTPAVAPAVPARRPALPVVAVLVSVAALTAALTQPLWVDSLYPSRPAPVVAAVDHIQELEQLRLQLAEIPALKAQLAALGQRLEYVENANPVPSLASVDFGPIESRLAALEARPAGGVDAHSLEQLVAGLREEMGQTARLQDAQKTLMVAALQLVTAWQTGQAFDAPWLAALAAASVADPALEVDLDDAAPMLLPWREQGIPRFVRLTAEYPALAQKIVAAAVPVAGGWWQQSLARIRGLVVVRRQGEIVSGSDMAADAIMARAEVRLGQNDLAGAVAELEKLDEAAGIIAGDWLDAARARLQADALAAKLTQRAAGGLLAGGAVVPDAHEHEADEADEAESAVVPAAEVAP